MKTQTALCCLLACLLPAAAKAQGTTGTFRRTTVARHGYSGGCREQPASARANLQIEKADADVAVARTRRLPTFQTEAQRRSCSLRSNSPSRKGPSAIFLEPDRFRLPTQPSACRGGRRTTCPRRCRSRSRSCSGSASGFKSAATMRDIERERSARAAALGYQQRQALVFLDPADTERADRQQRSARALPRARSHAAGSSRAAGRSPLGRARRAVPAGAGRADADHASERAGIAEGAAESAASAATCARLFEVEEVAPISHARGRCRGGPHARAREPARCERSAAQACSRPSSTGASRSPNAFLT